MLGDRRSSGRMYTNYQSKVLADDKRFAKALLEWGYLTRYQFDRAFDIQQRNLENGILTRISTILLKKDTISYDHAEEAFKAIGEPRRFCHTCGARYRPEDNRKICKLCNTPFPIQTVDKYSTEMVEKVVLGGAEALGLGSNIEGQQFGKFVIMELISHGASGAVHKAYDTEDNRVIALKILHPWLSQKDKFCKRFQGEAQVLSQINHPNVVRFYESGQVNEYLYISMELLHGKDLGDRLQVEAQIPPSDVLSILYEMAKVLDFGVREFEPGSFIHRDIKPANIFQCEDGSCRLMDFGLVRSKMYFQESITHDYAVIGTIPYMSPEQVFGKKEIDIRSDIFALGSTAYHLLCGDFPFKGENIMQMRLAIMECKPIPVQMHIPSLPAEVVYCMNKMLVADPDERFQSPGEMLDVLEPIIDGTIG
ncbi:MAG: serine/threonine protein kinase [Planctomycetota bacterium]|nr:MAG: serine/threonine protein kinase [Planctomycetota bacterium]